MRSLVWDDCCRQTRRPGRWLEIKERRSPVRRRKKGRIKNSLQLRIAPRIDIELRGSALEPHLIAENPVHYSSCRVIRDFRAIPVFRVCLFPYGAVFQPNDGPASQALKAAINAAYN